ncbi:MAG: hypothetical protein Tsb0034_23990 [Ekhidna sp.]
MKSKLVLLLLSLALFSCNSEESLNGDDLFEDQMYKEAIAAYTEYLTTHPDHTKSLYNRGRSYEEMGAVEKAKADFMKVVELDKQHINAYLSLAKLAYNDHQYNKVLVFASQALELNENSAQGHFLSARGAHQLGYFDQALESYNNAISINKDFGEAYLYRGALKIGLKKSRSACEDFKFARLLNVDGADKAVKDYCK